MPAKDLGSKHLCFKCSTKFYDLKKPDPICPKCGADQRESPANRPAEPRRGRLSKAAAIVPVPEPEEPAAAESEEEIEDFEEEGGEDVAAAADEDV